MAQHTTNTVKPPPPHPDQPVPMAHANTQNNHTTLVVMSTHYGSHMFNATMMGFDLLMKAYTATGTVTEGQLYTALWPENGLLNQASLIFGPDVVSYVKARDVFSIRVGTYDRHLSTPHMQRVATALTELNDTVLMRRAIYVICTVGARELRSLITPHGNENTLRLIDYARTLHQYIPDIDEHLARSATTSHRPMRHGVAAQYYQTSTGTSRVSHTATLPTYIGRDGGVCTSTPTLHHSSTLDDLAADRVVSTNPVVIALNTVNTSDITVELRSIAASLDCDT